MITRINANVSTRKNNPNFKREFNEKHLKAFREGDVGIMNGVINITPGIYTARENKAKVEPIIRELGDKCTQTLKNIGRYLGIEGC